MLVLRPKHSLVVQQTLRQSTKLFTQRSTVLLYSSLRTHPRSVSQQASYDSQFRSYTNHPRQICYRQYTSNAEPISFADPTRPDLFYHLVPPPSPYSSNVPAFALSFLQTPPPSVNSYTVIGWLPASSEGQEGEAGLNDFKENRKQL